MQDIEHVTLLTIDAFVCVISKGFLHNQWEKNVNIQQAELRTWKMDSDMASASNKLCLLYPIYMFSK